ncbi:MAG: hypothetical protein NC191_00480 [Muribaculaceae bacterium]|nr:hypothetical protein [Muribaculaceae bacterium]
MNIQKLNPFGYEAKTEKGNTYKKSNIGVIGAAVMGASSVAAYSSKNKIVKAFTTASILDTIEELAKCKISPKIKPVILGVCTIADIVGGFWLGAQLDKILNKQTAAKADAAAEAKAKTVNTEA